MQSDFTVNILLVDDHPENLLSLEAILEPLGANLVRSNSGEEALRVLLERDFALILLDVQMPRMDGFETASLIRQRRRSRQTPIIFLTAFSATSEMLSKGYSLGAVDYLHKPIDPVMLLSKATVFVDLFKKTQAIQQQSLVLERQAAQLATANTQLRQSEEQFRLLSEGSPIGIFLTNPAGTLTYTNPRFDAICGISAPASLQVDLLQTIHPEDRSPMTAQWMAYLSGEQELSAEFRLLNPDLHWINLRSRPLYSKQHSEQRSGQSFSEQRELLGHLGTIEDITERKQAEAIRAEMIRAQIARQEAEAINRMKDEFLAVLSHELRTPLNAMLGWAKILSDSFVPQSVRRLDEATVARGLSIIQRNAQSQTQLIEDLLDVSRIIQGKFSLKMAPIQLPPVIEAAIESVRPQAQAKAIHLTVHLTLDEIQVMGDAVRLQQVVLNLLSNAIKFTPDGGKVKVELERVEEEDWEIGRSGDREVESHELGSTADPIFSHPSPPPLLCPYAQITITDTGIGIAPDFLPHVFDRFRQADSSTTRSYTGLGLGLAIVRHLVELHGGMVQVESEGIDRGAVFTVGLPLHQAIDYQKDTLEAVSPIEAGIAGQKILLVDDEADSRELLAFMLEQQGAVVTVAESAAQAIAALEVQPFNGLISDISMPNLDGYNLIQKVRSLQDNLNAGIPAIALTAHASEADQQRVLAAGFQAHVAKPIEPEQFLETLVDLLRPQSGNCGR